MTPDKRPTIREVAQHAGVSVGTASRVLNNRPNVNAGIRARVEAAVAALDYRINAQAQSMRSGATRTVGLIVRDITVPFLARFVRAAQDELMSSGYMLLLANSDDIRERELALLQLLGRRRVDGLIMTTISEADPELAAARAGVGAPIVLMDRDPQADTDAVMIRHDVGLRQAVSLLAGLGHRRIGLITGGGDVRPSRDRIAAYRQGLTEAGLPFDPALLRATSFQSDAGHMGASLMLGMADRPTAIIAGGASLLAGVLEAANASGLSVPGDLSVVGAADSDLALLASPSITVVRWNYADLGRMTARLLLDRLSGAYEGPGRRFFIPTELVSRQSCAPPPR